MTSERGPKLGEPLQSKWRSRLRNLSRLRWSLCALRTFRALRYCNSMRVFVRKNDIHIHMYMYIYIHICMYTR